MKTPTVKKISILLALVLFLSPAALAKDENTFTLEKAQEWASNSLIRVDPLGTPGGRLCSHGCRRDMMIWIGYLEYPLTDRRAAEDEEGLEKLGKY